MKYEDFLQEVIKRYDGSSADLKRCNIWQIPDFIQTLIKVSKELKIKEFELE